MQQHQAKSILENEDFKAALRILVQKIKEEDTVMGVKTFEELIGRQIAIEKIVTWIDDIFQIQSGEWNNIEDSDYDGILKKIK